MINRHDGHSTHHNPRRELLGREMVAAVVPFTPSGELGGYRFYRRYKKCKTMSSTYASIIGEIIVESFPKPPFASCVPPPPTPTPPLPPWVFRDSSRKFVPVGVLRTYELPFVDETVRVALGCAIALRCPFPLNCGNVVERRTL